MPEMKTESKRALQDAYNILFHTDAWKDVERFIDQEREVSMRKIDSKPASDLTIGEVCEERGIRKGLIKILNHVQNRRDGV